MNDTSDVATTVLTTVRLDVLDRLTRHVADTDADNETLIRLVSVALGYELTDDQASDLIQQATHVLLFENGLANWSDFLPHRPVSTPRWLDGKEDETAATYAWLLRDVVKRWPAQVQDRVA